MCVLPCGKLYTLWWVTFGKSMRPLRWVYKPCGKYNVCNHVSRSGRADFVKTINFFQVEDNPWIFSLYRKFHLSYSYRAIKGSTHFFFYFPSIIISHFSWSYSVTKNIFYKCDLVATVKGQNSNTYLYIKPNLIV